MMKQEVEVSVEFIFWDNDGVLVDTEGLYYQASRDVLASIGFDLTVEQFIAVSLSPAKAFSRWPPMISP